MNKTTRGKRQKRYRELLTVAKHSTAFTGPQVTLDTSPSRGHHSSGQSSNFFRPSWERSLPSLSGPDPLPGGESARLELKLRALLLLIVGDAARQATTRAIARPDATQTPPIAVPWTA